MTSPFPSSFKMFFSLLFIGSLLESSTSLAAQDSNWEKMREENGIITYKREIPGSPLLAFKGEGQVDAPIERVAAVIFDTKRAPEWVVDLEESKIVQWLSNDEFVEYDHIRTFPIITADRDFASVVKMKIDPNTKEMTFQYRPAETGVVPETRHVRGSLMYSAFHLKPLEGNTKTYIVGEIHADPRGAIPKWLVNLFQQGWPFDTLKNLRNQLAKKDIQIDSRIQALFQGKNLLLSASQ